MYVTIAVVNVVIVAGFVYLVTAGHPWLGALLLVGLMGTERASKETE